MTPCTTLDTNILFDALDHHDPAKHAMARHIVERAALVDCVLTGQCLAELFASATRRQLLNGPDAAAIVRTWSAVFPVVYWDGDDLPVACDAMIDHGLSFWDALLWATARHAGCDYVLSEDMQHGRRLLGVTIVNPFAATAASLLETLLEQ